MDEVTWAALTLTLTLLGGLYTWFAFRRRGLVAGLRGLGVTLLPLALLLTDTLQLVSRIATAVSDWVWHLAWSPATWLGIVLAGIAVTCFVVSGVLTDRGAGRPRAVTADRRPQAALPAARGRRARPAGPPPADDPEMAEIEALLRKRGIT